MDFSNENLLCPLRKFMLQFSFNAAASKVVTTFQIEHEILCLGCGFSLMSSSCAFVYVYGEGLIIVEYSMNIKTN